MTAIPSLSIPHRAFSDPWRVASAGFALLACATGVLAVVSPQAAGWPGFALLLGLGGVGILLLFAIWPREAISPETRRIAEVAARSHIAWVVTGADGGVVGCNEAYRRMVGDRAGELPAPPQLALTGEATAAALYRLTRNAAAGKTSEEIIEFGQAQKVAASVRPLKGGETTWWFTPVLASRAPGTGITKSPASAMEILEQAPIGAATVTADGQIAACNRAFTEFFNQGSLSGRRLAELVDGGDQEQLKELLSGAAHSPLEIRSAAAREHTAELYVSPADNGAEKRRTIYLVDVSEQKALETKFAQSQKMQAVGQLAGGVAHDFNNLLTVIIGNSELLLMRHQASDPSFRDINDIRQNAIRAANLVRQLLAFSRQQTMQPRAIDLGIGISELGELLRRLLPEGITLKIDGGGEVWPVHADEAQLNNAIINLVVNARDAMPKGGTVTIRIANETIAEATMVGSANMPAGDYVRIEVSDSGVGIPDEYIGKIFDPFFTTKPVGEGTGLGLATVYGIVKQSGAFIAVESNVGRGTSFCIYLPRHHGEVETRAEIAPVRDVTGHETILLVEDEDAVRSFAARALKQRGYQVIEAASGEQALEIVKARPNDIQLIVTDVVMPNMDGPTLVRAVRRLRPDIQVIFMSGYAEEAFRRNDEKPEDLHFLPKPFGLKQLAAKVKDVLSGTASH
jgi:two-component system cell cycle sensor histidine kinase/response regulator CckA